MMEAEIEAIERVIGYSEIGSTTVRSNLGNKHYKDCIGNGGYPYLDCVLSQETPNEKMTWKWWESSSKTCSEEKLRDRADELD